jgi:hypothetical protein
MNDERMTDELHKLIEITSLPFVALEQTFAADSSGFSVSQYERWQEIKPASNVDVRSKSERAMLNEVLCKIICHNILCIVKATFELGLEANELRRTKPTGWNPRVIEGGRDRHEALHPA